MAKRIVCTTEDEVDHETPHVTGLGIGSITGQPSYRETVDTVRDELADGATYYVKSLAGRSRLAPRECATCGFETVRAVSDDGPGLDDVPDC